MEEIVSTTPAPITLEVRRGGQEMKFHFGRVRETTLAALSHQKYVLRRRLLSGARTGLVPADETADEVQDLSRFYDQIDRSVGFRLIDGLDVPQSTPEERLRELVATQYGGSEAGRSVGVTPLGFGENTYLPGFTAVLLKDPEEVLVDTVFPNSPGHHAGLLPGDQILEVSEHPVHGRSVEELSNLILKPDRQRQVVVEVRRGTARLTLTLQTVRTSEINLPSVFTRIDAGATSLNPDAYIIGFWALYADDPREAVVDELRYPSPAFDAGLHVGDRIQAINAVPIGQLSREELAKIFQNNSAHPLRVEILRLGNKMELRVMPVTYREAEARIGRKVTKIGSTPCHCPDV